MGNVRTAGAECAGCFFCLLGAIFFQSIGCIFSSLIDDLFFAFFGSMEAWRSLSVYCGSSEGKKTCETRKCHCKREKETKNQLLRVWEREKAAPDPKMQKKRVWEIDFHESDPNRRKISLHNAKKYALAGLREKKAVSDPHIAMQAGKTPEIFEEQVCGNRKKPSKRLPAG